MAEAAELAALDQRRGDHHTTTLEVKAGKGETAKKIGGAVTIDIARRAGRHLLGQAEGAEDGDGGGIDVAHRIKAGAAEECHRERIVAGLDAKSTAIRFAVASLASAARPGSAAAVALAATSMVRNRIRRPVMGRP